MNFRKLEAMLLIMVAMLFTYASAAGMQQEELADKVLRLHVLANSNTEEDQRVKLCVRDQILAYAEPLLQDAETQDDVRQILNRNLQALANIAQIELWRQGATDNVTVQLSEEYYPTRDYTDFSLPAGRYVGLRVTIGQAEGNNWWCVIFPPLCEGTSSARADGLTREERALTRRDGTKYVVRFKAAEIVGEMRAFFAGE